jgi:hypothetical protein
MQNPVIPLELFTPFPIPYPETRFLFPPQVAADWSSLLFYSANPATSLQIIKLKLSACYGSHTLTDIYTGQTRSGATSSQQYFRRRGLEKYEFLTVIIEGVDDPGQMPEVFLQVFPNP